jgi:hypothetical protein
VRTGERDLGCGVGQYLDGSHRAFVEVASGTASCNEKKPTPALPFTPRHLPKYVLSNGSSMRASGVRNDHIRALAVNLKVDIPGEAVAGTRILL